MFVLAFRVDLHLPQAASLKDRRAIVSPILDGARHRFRISAADVGAQGKWQTASLGFVVVAAAERVARETIDSVERFVFSFPEVEVGTTQREWMELDQ